MSFTREDYVGYHKLEAFKGAKSLRTLLAISIDVYQHFYLSNKVLIDLLPTLTLLRVLSLSHFAIREVPDSIGSLKHLRYLNLSETRLRHFDIRNTPLLGKLPLGISELESLQTLTKIIIGGGDDGLKINELKGLKNLHGEVSIEGLHKVQSATHAREATLSLKKITRLELQWVDVFDGFQMGSLEKEVLNELKPNSDTLKELSIMSYVGTQFSYWVGDPSFHKLVNMSIRGCRKCTSLPPFGLLPSLQYLSIQGKDAVEVIGMEVTGGGDVAFPSLKFLSFEDMLGLGEWSTKNEGLVAVFPCLHVLYITNCPQLTNVSLQALTSLKVLEIDGCGDGVLRSLVQERKKRRIILGAVPYCLLEVCM
ncbi:putative leucine-rich repeat domain superfamily [Helianthus annuus]|nr:putative leucine-rich repeat domain superfamily [Helianthus annuus]